MASGSGLQNANISTIDSPRSAQDINENQLHQSILSQFSSRSTEFGDSSSSNISDSMRNAVADENVAHNGNSPTNQSSDAQELGDSTMKALEDISV